jgi:hypothetical protein
MCGSMLAVGMRMFPPNSSGWELMLTDISDSSMRTWKGLRAKLETAGVATEDGRPAPWRRFFVRDPFGNRIELHAPGGLRA